MLTMKDSYYKPIEKDINYYFYKFYWEEIFKILEDDKKQLLNSNSALIAAIRSGRIYYKSGLFSGTYNAQISKELRKFAKYNRRTKKWEGLAPPDVLAAATVANSRGEKLNKRIQAAIEKIPSRVQAEINKLVYSIQKPLQSMSKEADKSLKSIGVDATMTPELSQRLTDNYTKNQNINISNWTEVEIERLRDVIEKNVLSGYNRRELRELIEVEYGVSRNKAKFLARQETSLFLAEVRDERYVDAGLKYYKWSTSKDNRVVGKPGGLYPEGGTGHGNHYVMQGKICKFSDPTVYADNIEDAKKNKWKSKLSIGADNTHPGQAFNCRCTSIPLVI